VTAAPGPPRQVTCHKCQQPFVATWTRALRWCYFFDPPRRVRLIQRFMWCLPLHCESCERGED